MARWLPIRDAEDFATYTKDLDESILIVRGVVDGVCVPGYLRLKEGLAYLSDRGEVHCTTTFDLFVIEGSRNKFAWHYLDEGESIPSNALVVGYSPSGENSIHVGKVTVNGEELYGRALITLSNEAVINVAARDGVVHRYSFYVLVENKT